MERHFSLCTISRWLNPLEPGTMICATAHRIGGPLRHLLDVVLYYRDGPDHCLRMAVFDERIERIRAERDAYPR